MQPVTRVMTRHRAATDTKPRHIVVLWDGNRSEINYDHSALDADTAAIRTALGEGVAIKYVHQHATGCEYVVTLP